MTKEKPVKNGVDKPESHVAKPKPVEHVKPVNPNPDKPHPMNSQEEWG